MITETGTTQPGDPFPVGAIVMLDHRRLQEQGWLLTYTGPARVCRVPHNSNDPESGAYMGWNVNYIVRPTVGDFEGTAVVCLQQDLYPLTADDVNRELAK